MKKQKDSGLLIQGSILAAAGLITKIIGVVYKIPLTGLLGEYGWGTFMNAFSVYGMALTFSYNSIPMAISKLVSESNATGNEKRTQKVFFHSAVFALFMGLAAALILFFGADFFEKIIQTTGIAPSIRVLSVTVFTVMILGIFRGYFQGYGNMVPTSVSQIAEQVVNAAVAIICVVSFGKIYTDPDTFVIKGAMGACFGTLAGSVAALIFLAAAYFRFRRGRRNELQKSEPFTEKTSAIYRAVILTVIPMIISQTVYNIGGIIDSIIFKYNLVTLKGNAEKTVTAFQGFFTGQYNQLVNLPISVTTALAITLLPAISYEYSKGNIKARDEKMKSVLKLTSLIAFPGAVGIAVMARPMIKLLFSEIASIGWKLDLTSGLLQLGFLSVVTYSFSTVTTSILQGSGHMKKPVYNSAFSLVLHLLLVFLLTRFTDLDVYALVIADVLFPMIIMILNIRSMKKDMNYRLSISEIFTKPMLCSVVMGFVCAGVYMLFSRITGAGNFISFTLAVAAAVCVYFLMIFRMKYFTVEEIYDLPMGRTIIRKFRIYS